MVLGKSLEQICNNLSRNEEEICQGIYAVIVKIMISHAYHFSLISRAFNFFFIYWFTTEKINSL